MGTVRDLVQGPQDYLWLGTDHMLYRWDEPAGTWQPAAPDTLEVVSLETAASGEGIWRTGRGA